MENRIAELEREVAELKRQLEERLKPVEQICANFAVGPKGELRILLKPRKL